MGKDIETPPRRLDAGTSCKVLWDIVCVIVIVVNYKVAIVLLGSLAWLLGLAAASWLLCLGLGSHERIRLGRERYVRGHGGARIAA